MNVFKPAITLSVMLTVLSVASSAHAKWVYQVDAPIRPSLSKTRTLTNPTIGEIQAAIAPNTRVIVIGDVDASNGGRLWVRGNDVRLDFSRASMINSSGGDTWEGFVNISGQRVELIKLRMQAVGNEGRSRGAVIYTPASDVRLVGCEFNDVADGLVADGNWERVAVVNTSFLNISTWNDSSMDGGYGIFMEDDDGNPDHLRLSNVTITLSGSSGQHGCRLSQVQNALIQNCEITANNKRSFWCYGVNRLAVRDCTFNRGSVLLNLMDHEYYTTRATTNVRMQNCVINHSTILQPLNIYCGRGTRNVRIRNIDITSSSSDRWLALGWRTEAESRNIRWKDGTITFNGTVVQGWNDASVSDFSQHDLESLKIGPW